MTSTALFGVVAARGLVGGATRIGFALTLLGFAALLVGTSLRFLITTLLVGSRLRLRFPIAAALLGTGVGISLLLLSLAICTRL